MKEIFEQIPVGKKINGVTVVKPQTELKDICDEGQNFDGPESNKKDLTPGQRILKEYAEDKVRTDIKDKMQRALLTEDEEYKISELLDINRKTPTTNPIRPYDITRREDSEGAWEKLKNEIQTDISKSEKVVNLLKENSINEKEKMYSEREARRKGFDKKLDDIGNEPKKYEYEAPIVKDKNKCCFKGICQEIVSLHEKKNKDYGNAADASYREFGIVSYVIRLNDKMNRLKSLTKPGVIQEVKDESIEDTLMDLAAYAIMALESIRNKV